MAFHCETEKQDYRKFQALRVTFVPDEGEPIFLTGGTEDSFSINNDLELLRINMDFIDHLSMAPGLVTNFVLDLEGVSGMDTMTLRIMAGLDETCRQFGGFLAVAHPNAEIRKMLSDGKVKHQITIVE